MITTSVLDRDRHPDRGSDAGGPGPSGDVTGSPGIRLEPHRAAAGEDHAEARRVLREQRRAEHKDKWEQFKNKIKSMVA
jgi:hypothetical protein